MKTMKVFYVHLSVTELILVVKRKHVFEEYRSVIEGIPVSSIGEYVFEDCSIF
jgi:hypothetical protein